MVPRAAPVPKNAPPKVKIVAPTPYLGHYPPERPVVQRPPVFVRSTSTARATSRRALPGPSEPSVSGCRQQTRSLETTAGNGKEVLPRLYVTRRQ
jgi:hypothetical protein